MNLLLLLSYTSLAALLLSWAVWPLLLVCASALLRRKHSLTSEFPTVSVVFAAHNEAPVMEAKVSNTLALDYPDGLLEVVVVSDGSTDGTDDILARISDPRLKVAISDRQRGKSSALNLARGLATGDLVLFTDANCMLDPSALRLLAAYFADPRVGMVSGSLQYVTDGGVAAAGGSLYWRYDTAIKKAEGSFGSLIGAVGPIFLLRRDLWRELAPLEVPDLALGLGALEHGQKALYDHSAFGTEVVAESTGHEVSRYRRIVSRSIPTAFHSLWRLVVRGRFAAAWFLGVHKLLRYLTAPICAVAVLSGLFAAEMPASVVVAVCAAGLAGAAAAGAPGSPLSGFRLLRMINYFALVQAAAGLGFVDWLSGRAQPTWSVPARTPTGASLSPDRSITRSPD